MRREIKFGALLERLPTTPSRDNWFATGHYARKSWVKTADGHLRPQLQRGLDPNKDQSYYLSSVSEDGLRRSLFPLEFLTKAQVRELARVYQLPTAERPESMGICFVGEKTKFSRFVCEPNLSPKFSFAQPASASYIPPHPGSVVDRTTGKTTAQHSGLWNYTIGENARIGGMPVKMFVSQKDASTNTVFVVPGADNNFLYSRTLYVPTFTWIWKDAPPPAIDTAAGYRAHVMHRYRMKEVPCTVYRCVYL